MLTELGSAISGDWSNFDGRTMRSQLNKIILVLDGELTVEEFREFYYLHPYGGGY